MSFGHRASVASAPLLALAVSLLPASGYPAKPAVSALAPIEIVAEGLGHLRGIVVDGAGTVLVTDRKKGALVEIAPGGGVSVVADRLRRPGGVALDREGRLLVVEGGRRRILRREADGAMTVLAAGVKHPRWIAAAPDGAVYVSAKGLAAEGEDGDEDDEAEPEMVVAVAPDERARAFAGRFRDLQGLSAEPGLVAAVARGRKGDRRALGTLYEIPVQPDGRAGPVSPLVTDQFVGPVGLATDRLGARFVSARSPAGEPWHRRVVVKVAPDGDSTLFAHGLEDPRGLAFGPDGSLYLADGRSGRVVRFVAPRPPSLEEAPPDVTNRREVPLRVRADAGDRLTVLGGRLPVDAVADEGGAALLSVPLLANAENHLLVFATAAAGRGLTSAPLPLAVIHDDVPPAVGLVTPRAGAIVHGTISAEASATDANGVGHVEFRLDGSPVGLDTTAPFRVSVDTRVVADGPRSLSVGARDRAGNLASLAAQVLVDNTPPEVRIAVPPSGWTGGGPVEVHVEAADLASGIALVELAVDGTPRLVTEAPPYRFRLDPQAVGAGPHVLVASATDRAGNRGDSAAVSITFSSVTVEISEPRDGARLPAGLVLVRGRVEADSAGVGVSVNGLPAAVEGEAFAALVPVTPDTRTLTAVATSASGATASQSVAIIVSAPLTPAPVLYASPRSGVAPLTAAFSLLGAPASAVIEVDFDGNGTPDFTGSRLDGQPFTYTRPGLYVPTAILLDAGGNRVTAHAVLQVYDQAALDSSLRATWAALRDALRAGDVPRALAYVSSRSRPRYEALFRILSPRLSGIDLILTDLTLDEVGDQEAFYEMARTDAGIARSFEIRFSVDDDGLWRLRMF